jgi:acetyl-CoA acetyltransferase
MASAFMSRSSSLQAGGITILTPVLVTSSSPPADPARVNPNGGAIALGHPLGASGGRIMATMLNELERTGGRFSLPTMCEGGGLANAIIIERLG